MTAYILFIITFAYIVQLVSWICLRWRVEALEKMVFKKQIELTEDMAIKSKGELRRVK